MGLFTSVPFRNEGHERACTQEKRLFTTPTDAQLYLRYSGVGSGFSDSKPRHLDSLA